MIKLKSNAALLNKAGKAMRSAVRKVLAEKKNERRAGDYLAKWKSC